MYRLVELGVMHIMGFNLNIERASNLPRFERRRSASGRASLIILHPRIHRGFEPRGHQVGSNCAMLNFPAVYSRTQEKFINNRVIT